MKFRDGADLPELTSAGSLLRRPSFERDSDLSVLQATLWRRRIAFLVIFLVFTALAAAFSMLAPRSYKTTVTLIGGRGSNAAGMTDTSFVSGNVTSIPLLNELLAAGQSQSPETYVALFRSQRIAQQVIDDLGLKVRPRDLLQSLKVQPLTNTKLLELSVSWSDAAKSALIANDFARVFVEHERALISRQAENVLTFLSGQLPSAEAAVKAAEAQMASYETQRSIADLPTQMQAAVSASANIEAKIVQLNADYRQAEAQLLTVRAQLAQTAPRINGSSHTAQNPVAAQLRIHLSEVNTQLGIAQAQYTNQHPTVVALRKQRDEMQAALKSQPDRVLAEDIVTTNPLREQLAAQAARLQSDISGNISQRAALQRDLSALTPKLEKMPAQAIRLAELQRNRKLAEDMLTALQQKYKEATISKTTSLSDVAITEPAAASAAVAQPNRRLLLTLGPVLALLLAFVGVLTLEYFDNSIKDERDLSRQFVLPVLTSLPRLRGGELGATPAPVRGMMIEAFLQLLMSLRYSADKPLRTLAVTSPRPGDGKSTIALNAAVAMGSIHPSVLLIDADIRKPTLHERLGLPNTRGFSDALVGTAQISDVLQHTEYAGVDFISSGFAAPNPFALFQSARFDELIEALGRSYQMIVFDTPALLPLTDAAMIAGKVEGTVLVISAGETDPNSIKRAFKRLASVANANLLGFVLNNVNPGADDMEYGQYATWYDDRAKSQLVLPLPDGNVRA